MKDSETSKGRLPWLSSCPSCSSTLLHICQRANQSKDTGEAPLQWEVMGLYTFPWTGHPFPVHTTLVVSQIPSVPPGCRFCCPVGVPHASSAFYICLTLLPARVLIGNNEAGEKETQSKCRSCWSAFL